MGKRLFNHHCLSHALEMLVPSFISIHFKRLIYIVAFEALPYIPYLQPHTPNNYTSRPTILYLQPHTHLPTIPPAYLSHTVAMAGQSIIKRPSIYTLSELERYPTLNDIYAATLPFSENTMLCKWPVWQNHYRGNARWLFTPPSWVIKSIKRTQERWTVSNSIPLPLSYFSSLSTVVLIKSHGSDLYD